MDVNQTTAIASVYPDAKKSPEHRDPKDKDADKDNQPDENPSGSWRDLAAVDVDLNLLDGMTPEAQGLINSLNQRIEPLRAELELAKHREAHFCKLAARHSFLNLPCRREFMRELTHILTHIDHVTPPPLVMVIHMVGAEAVRLKAGRAALDRVLGDVSDIFSKLLQPSDILGNLGGDDFGIIMLSGDGNAPSGIVEQLKQGVRSYRFAWAVQPFSFDVVCGTSQLGTVMTAEMALDAADQDLRKTHEQP